MNTKMNLNLTKPQQFSLQQEITEPNESETNNTSLFESENHLMQEGEAVLIADGDPTINPPPPQPEISAEPEVPEVIV